MPVLPGDRFILRESGRDQTVGGGQILDIDPVVPASRARPDRLDLNPEKAAERDIRYLEARLRTAILTPPPADPAEVAFATTVTVADESGRETTYEIVGEDEADAGLGRIAPYSPLARALIGARVGDTVEWRRPSGAVALKIVAIDKA